MSDKLMDIAKECGADFSMILLPSGNTRYIEFDEQQLHAYTEQVCAPLVEALKAIRAEAYNNDDLNYFEIADSALMNYTEIMGDKK